MCMYRAYLKHLNKFQEWVQNNIWPPTDFFFFAVLIFVRTQSFRCLYVGRFENSRVFSSNWKWRDSSMHPSIHLWRYSPFRALASLTRRLHSSLFVAVLLHPLVPSRCSASLWTTSAYLVLGLPTGLVVWKFPFRTFFGILSSSIHIIWPAHSILLILTSSTIFGSLYKL